ncbi:MAG: hypothetical protein K6D54_07640 [Bacteroidales bacterium]|nr:hypothetical protein [Bacteroidales bacterium]
MGAEKRNPWMGLASYQDPETTAYPFLFCGRRNESYDVAQLVENNIFVTLYGKSGTGKTSLLNAGVFPLLREDQFLPVSVRLGIEALGTSFQQCILSKINEAIKKKEGNIQTVNIVPLPDTEDTEEFFWCHFARTRYEDKEGRLVYPVIVLDQFEEVFKDRREEADVLLRQIYFLMNDTHILSDRTVDGIPYVYDFNFRFVVTIREDDLFRLEDAIDNNFLPEMKRCRFRLRNLTEEGAREVIMKPSRGLFLESDQEKITESILAMAREEEGSTVSSNILSLICNRIFVEHIKEGSSDISLPLVEKFIRKNPFEQFYKEATQGLSSRERSYIETHFVDSSGRRNSVAESDFLRAVKNGKILFDGDRKILQRVSTSSSSVDTRVELIHDSFCEPLSVLKTKRERRRIINGISLAVAVAMISVGIGLYMTQLNRKLRTITAEAEEKSLMLMAQNDSIQGLIKVAEDAAAIAAKEQAKAEENAAIAAKEQAKAEDAAAETAKAQAKAEEAAAEAAKAQAKAEEAAAEAAKEKAMRLALQAEIRNSSGQESSNHDEIIYDGIEYAYASPSERQLDEWKQLYHNIFLNKIMESGALRHYHIPEDMLKEEPGIVYLILISKSMSDEKEKQSWFDLYPLMNSEQLYKLYSILYRERRRLGEIDAKYQKKQAQVSISDL